MSEEQKNVNSSVSPQPEQDVLALVKKIQQQLTFLEKKIDTLIGQSQAAPFRERSFSKPYRPFDRSRAPSRGRDFEKRHAEESRGFGHKKKAYDNPRGSEFGHERHFDKPRGDEKRPFHPKKKPFYYGRKERG